MPAPEMGDAFSVPGPTAASKTKKPPREQAALSDGEPEPHTPIGGGSRQRSCGERGCGIPSDQCQTQPGITIHRPLGRAQNPLHRLNQPMAIDRYDDQRGIGLARALRTEGLREGFELAARRTLGLHEGAVLGIDSQAETTRDAPSFCSNTR